jgi:hypothetical protein
MARKEPLNVFDSGREFLLEAVCNIDGSGANIECLIGNIAGSILNIETSTSNIQILTFAIERRPLNIADLGFKICGSIFKFAFSFGKIKTLTWR